MYSENGKGGGDIVIIYILTNPFIRIIYSRGKSLQKIVKKAQKIPKITERIFKNLKNFKNNLKS